MGCGAAALRAAGYTAKELKDAGFSAKELRDAGFSPSELRNAGFSAGELRQAGFSADELKAAGFSAGELRDAGFDAAELAKAGFSADELKAAGFSDGELTRAGIAPATPPQPIAVTPEQPVVAAAPQPAAAAAPTEASSLPSISGEPGSIAALQQLQARQAERLSAQERQDRIGQLQQTMATQASDLFASWSPPSSQQYVAGQEPKQQGTTSPGAIVPAANAQLLSAASQYPSVKAGTILFGVMDTSVNSDEPGPILATIVEGPYKGSRLLGQFQRVEKRLLLSFTIMNVPSLPQSVGINAVAIDPDDARTALATHVDSHYLLRFGTLFASSFITGLGNAISQSDSTTNITVSGISTTTASKSAAEQGLMALGEVGKQFGSVLAPIYTKPPTVTLDAGTGIEYCLWPMPTFLPVHQQLHPFK
ncbi:MAG: pentapeptide repeat-containing protein [Coxiellaceae bacterium]|nr:MAG: pentapeptide repeat-containing protein [Coxiellaceae bacterium]